MSADAMIDQFDILPRRTWRQWWGQLPAWQRGLAWLAAGVAGLHLALLARLLIGQWEANEIRALRQRNVFLQYAWEKKSERFPFEHWLLAGMHGKSCDNVTDLRLPQIATDADLKLIGKYFHHVKYLNLENAPVTSAGVQALRGCPRLECVNLSKTDIDSAALEGLRDCRPLWVLDLSETNVGDEGMEILAALPKLKSLSLGWTFVTDRGTEYLMAAPALNSLMLTGTLVTDRSLPFLEKLPSLELAEVSSTGITRSVYASPPAPRKYIQNNTMSGGMFNPWPHSLAASIRWADGEKTFRFRGPYRLAIEGPLSGVTRQVHQVTGIGLNRKDLWWYWRDFHPWDIGDGNYRFTLKLGDHEAEPVVVWIMNHADEVVPIEFVMPVTKAEALSKISPSGGR